MNTVCLSWWVNCWRMKAKTNTNLKWMEGWDGWCKYCVSGGGGGGSGSAKNLVWSCVLYKKWVSYFLVLSYHKWTREGRYLTQKKCLPADKIWDGDGWGRWWCSYYCVHSGIAGYVTWYYIWDNLTFSLYVCVISIILLLLWMNISVCVPPDWLGFLPSFVNIHGRKILLSLFRIYSIVMQTQSQNLFLIDQTVLFSLLGTLLVFLDLLFESLVFLKSLSCKILITFGNLV